jgi:CheY-like chemotaxis protein
MSNRATESPYFHVIQEDLEILFVDDDPILREFASVHLSSEHVRVTTAEDGLDALEKMHRHAPDIVLLDLEMPNMDGFQLLKELSQTEVLRDLPVIVVTGREDIVAIDRAYQAGAVSFVVKPLSWRQIAYQVRYVHRSHHQERAMSAERDKAAETARKVRVRLATVAKESSEFLALALTLYPELRAPAARYAEELGAALAGSAGL